jgi:hypothetical protein
MASQCVSSFKQSCAEASSLAALYWRGFAVSYVLKCLIIEKLRSAVLLDALKLDFGKLVPQIPVYLLKFG